MGIENIRGLNDTINSYNKNKTKKFKIVWLEFFETMEDYKEKANLSINHKHTGYTKGYGEEFECWEYFEAENIEKAKQKIKEDYYEVDFFTVFDDKGNRLFTEEDINYE